MAETAFRRDADAVGAPCAPELPRFAVTAWSNGGTGQSPAKVPMYGGRFRTESEAQWHVTSMKLYAGRKDLVFDIVPPR